MYVCAQLASSSVKRCCLCVCVCSACVQLSEEVWFVCRCVCVDGQ